MHAQGPSAAVEFELNKTVRHLRFDFAKIEDLPTTASAVGDMVDANQ
jgi:hypothetical protein